MLVRYKNLKDLCNHNQSFLFLYIIDSLNKELQDPKVTTDPAKLSSLHQQSEKLLEDYNKLVMSNDILSNYPEVQSLTEAHENVKANLEGKWRKSFSKTPEYFKLIYGSKEIKLIDDSKYVKSLKISSFLF